MKESRIIAPAMRTKVILFDDPDVRNEGGIMVSEGPRRKNLDYVVARSKDPQFLPGARVILDDPIAGRKLKICGVCYRIVEVSHIIALVDD